LGFDHFFAAPEAFDCATFGFGFDLAFGFAAGGFGVAACEGFSGCFRAELRLLLLLLLEAAAGAGVSCMSAFGVVEELGATDAAVAVADVAD